MFCEVKEEGSLALPLTQATWKRIAARTKKCDDEERPLMLLHPNRQILIIIYSMSGRFAIQGGRVLLTSMFAKK